MTHFFKYLIKDISLKNLLIFDLNLAQQISKKQIPRKSDARFQNLQKFETAKEKKGPYQCRLLCQVHFIYRTIMQIKGTFQYLKQ